VSVPGVATGPLRPAYDVVIVGGGIQGLALGYELACRGVRDVCILEASYPGAGASGRNGELIRSAFASREWATLFDLSLRKWHGLSSELGANTLFARAGYLVLASTAEQVNVCRSSAARHRELGIRTQLLDATAVRDLVPALDPALVRGGLYQADGGFAHHDASVWAYVRAAARAGVEVHAATTVTGIVLDGTRIAGVDTTRGRIATRVVVDAAGGRARDVAGLAGVAIPTETQRWEALVTESVRPFLRPGVALVALLGYCHQTTRGEFVGGAEIRGAVPRDGMRTTLEGLRDTAQKFVRAFPLLGGVRVLRQWAGIVDVSPDFAPILGAAPGVDGLWLDCGWSYGFMGAPGAAVLLAEAIAEGRVPETLAPFAVERFAQGRPIVERSLVVAPAGDDERCSIA
jgi:heterotetrameric sarcosine oxidase beta subunit